MIRILMNLTFFAVPVAFSLVFGSCASETQPAKLAVEKRHYERLKLGERPAVWEDGFRTSLEPGCYEWWYFDAHLDDGSVLVIVFFTRPYVDIDGEAVPQVEIRLTLPDGKEQRSLVKVSRDDFIASRDRCDVNIGKSRIVGDLKNYEIHVESDTMNADIVLKGGVPAWRPATGHIFFGEDEQKYFAWLPSVPYGTVAGTISVNGKQRAVRGSGYHDHNWGNILLGKALNNWWWSRAQFGDYTIITSEMIGEEKYGHVKLPIFLLARKGEILMEDGGKMTLLRSKAETHPVSGKPMENTISFVYADPGRGLSAKYTLERKRDIVVNDLLTMLPSWKAFLARLLGVRPWYHRIQGDATLDIDIKGKKEHLTAETVYELMYLGKPLTLKQ